MPNFPVLKSFLDLIRHGKNHNSNPLLQQGSAQPQQTTSKEAAEMLVNEEKESRNKMPSYSGLEHYRLLEKMGDGAFSNVYEAISISTAQKIAVKVVRKYELNASQAGEKHLNRQFKKKPRAIERTNILKEVQIMRGINHSSIVKLYSFSESPEHYFLVLELMEGGELFHQIVKLTYFSENLSRHVILQVAQGIRYLHEVRGVVHRDIKPENLLFEPIPIIPSKNPVRRPYDEEKEDEGEFIPGVGGGGIGRVKIADFGLSKVVWDEHTMTPCGTVGYTAPEIVKDQRYSKSVDMWALGCVLYTFLCGFPPFYDESITVLTEKVARGYYTFLSPWWDDINSSAKDLITHLLCVDPERRYTIDEFLAHPWCTEAPTPPSVPTPYKEFTTARPMDSPLLAALGGRPDGRSPGITSLREAFDITYAVHRMEEEGARKKRYRGNGLAVHGFLGGLDEDEESPKLDEEDSSDSSSDTAYEACARELPARHTRVDPLADRKRKSPRNFQLDLDGATLLERRHRRSEPPGSSLAKQSNGSPLKLDALRVND
ncbi:Protein kinase-like domain containing protein [Amanita muscaria]